MHNPALKNYTLALSLSLSPVSYTHLDVYKRQKLNRPKIRMLFNDGG